MNYCVDCRAYVNKSVPKAGIIRMAECSKSLHSTDPVDGRKYYYTCEYVRAAFGKDMPCHMFEKKAKGFFGRKIEDIKAIYQSFRFFS